MSLSTCQWRIPPLGTQDLDEYVVAYVAGQLLVAQDALGAPENEAPKRSEVALSRAGRRRTVSTR